MNDVLLSPIRLTELETLIQNSVERALKVHQSKDVEPTYQSEQLLTVDELATLLHLSKPTIYSNYSKGLIPGGCKQGKRVYFDRNIIVNWIRSGRKLTIAEIEAEAKAGQYLKNRRTGR